MKDGTKQTVSGVQIGTLWGIDKREPSYFVLTHLPTGAFVTSSRTQKALKELCNKPEMIDATDVKDIAKAVVNFWNERGWK